MPIPFRPIARLLTCTLRPTPHVNHTYAESLPAILNQADPRQGVLITVNHYSSPGFQALWIATLISAILPLDIHWVMTAGWTNSGWLSGLTHWLFPHLARVIRVHSHASHAAGSGRCRKTGNRSTGSAQICQGYPTHP